MFKTGMILLILLICITGVVLFIAPIKPVQMDATHHPNNLTPTPHEGISSCREISYKSTDEWQEKSDQSGYWIGGILVNESMSDDELFTLLTRYNVSHPENVHTYSSHAFGYYILINKTENATLPDSFLLYETSPGIGFSSPMYEFIEPSRKDVNGKISIPVILLFGSEKAKSDLYSKIVHYNISLHKTKIVYPVGLEPPRAKEERENLLRELNLDPNVLFTFKSYLEC
jgi:hypothetical protein